MFHSTCFALCASSMTYDIRLNFDLEDTILMLN